MSRVRQANTGAEAAVRQLVHSLGFRFRGNARALPGSPDLVNRRRHWAIFVHGCYWHAHEGCHLWKIPKANAPFWAKKFDDNRKRDQRKVEELESSGFRVLVIWQCELADREALICRVLEFLEASKAAEVSEAYRFVTGTDWVARIVATGKEVGVTLQEHRESDRPSVDAHAAFDRAFLRGSPRRLPKLRKPAIRAADLFCGCGGLSLGIREACWAVGRRFEVALAVDHDLQALGVYRSNFSPRRAFAEDLESILGDTFGVPPSTRERRWLKKLGEVDILVAGPPCQGHSDLNNRTRRNDPRNLLYKRVGRFVELVCPKHVLIENVPGVVHDREGALADTMELLRHLGYTIDSSVVDLASLGTPQKRKRHVLVASLAGSISIESVLTRHRTSARTLEWAIRDLETSSSEGLLDRAPRPSPENLERIQYLLQEGKYDLPNSLRPVCHRNDEHSYKSMYGRLSWTEPAQTITTGFGSPGQGRFIHPAQPRALTSREAARLQCLPDSFSFEGVAKRTQLAEMIGNAVPMKLSWAFALEFLALES